MTDRKTVPPSLEDVREFLTSLGSTVVPENFHDFYESNGWKVGRVKMVDWQATARRWSRGEMKDRPTHKPMSEWDRKQKSDRLRELLTRIHSYTHPGGSAWSANLDEAAQIRVNDLRTQADLLRKELNS